MFATDPPMRAPCAPPSEVGVHGAHDDAHAQSGAARVF